LRLPLTPVVAGRKAGFLAEELREVTRVRIADVVRQSRLTSHAASPPNVSQSQRRSRDRARKIRRFFALKPTPHHHNNKESHMEIKRSGSQPSSKGPADWFTGTVRIDPLFPATEPARAAGNSVTFEPGARTAWHTHPLGQTLIVTAGCGRAQRAGGPIEEIRPGDVIWFAPGEKHWHGAAPTTAMTHTAIQEHLNGKPVDWMEKVTDEQYGK
jgi:quercetin dioxygenase-like cupin family protein